MGILASTAWGIRFETLVMPGKVIKGHEKYESDCKKCHELLEGKTQNDLCLDCHKKVAADVRKKSGFHGKSKKVLGKKCRSCHTEHKGRNADVVGLNREVFPHDETDYPLEGSHRKVRCDKCHNPKKKFREAPSRCVDCHGKEEPHKGKLGKDCHSCHTPDKWKKVKFDHRKTRFPLKGKHLKVSCLACHPGERYKGITRECYSCHFLQNVHGERYGNKCSSCHNPEDWKKQYYDHSKTKFPLKGKHEKVACSLCHTGVTYKEKVPVKCVECHRDDDIHRGRYGEKCADCHRPEGWEKVSFDHSKTKFPLKGKHEKVACHLCHREKVSDGKKTFPCNSCHRQDDVHNSSSRRDCSECHSEKGWRVDLFFDHDLTRFPLLGLHLSAPCEGCHEAMQFSHREAKCVSCHREDDTHREKLGEECERCHTPNGWRIWEFNHRGEAKFPLDGAHEGLECTACHNKPVRGKFRLPRDCQGCHFQDDIHGGKFGQRCEWCHTTKNFKEIKSVIEQGIPGASPGESPEGGNTKGAVH